MKKLSKNMQQVFSTIQDRGGHRVCVDDLPTRTVLALERRGLISIERIGGHYKTLNRGAFGRWGGGSTTHTITSLRATIK